MMLMLRSLLNLFLKVLDTNLNLEKDNLQRNIGEYEKSFLSTVNLSTNVNCAIRHLAVSMTHIVVIGQSTINR
jgi:hypothetical protein